MANYLIGIDLGTTNIALAYVDLRSGGKMSPPPIESFNIPQLVAAGEFGVRSLLPSFLYLPGEHDLPAGAAALPWDEDVSFAVGEFARNHGSKIPGRLVASAKSWLCHGGVDRSAPLLPWSAPPEVERISPVEASAKYLRHLIDAWNFHMAGQSEDDRLERQVVVLTVPASFDDVARNLTVQAAKDAGIAHVQLLEEPQAAFYCWLATHSPKEAAAIKPGWFCLVVDVGGGTSDFTLIEALEREGELSFVRQAVGDHLLLGGDNMDLSLAKFVESKLPQAGKLDAVQYGMLTQACRQAKETLLGLNPPESHAVTVVGRGRKVIGGTLHTDLTCSEVERVILNGFFPDVPRGAELQLGDGTGLHEMGLPFVADSAVTRHLTHFLDQHTSTGNANSQALPPQAILFNGGVFQPAKLRQRIVEVLKTRYDAPQAPWHPLILHNSSLDLAVSVGAAYYGWLRHTGGKRIGGGIPRSYYLAVADAAAEQTVLCVVPQHLDEGEEVKLAQPRLDLALGQPVTFPLYTSTVREDDKAGDVFSVQTDQLWQLPPLHTILRGGKRSGVKTVPVTIASRCTEIGTVELWCEATEGDNRWRLEFNVRDIVMRSGSGSEQAVTSNEGAADPIQGLLDVWPEDQVQTAAQLIARCFSDSVETIAPKDLTKQLEQALEAPRRRWPMGLCRRLWDAFQEVAGQRRLSTSHLNRWYNLVGYCLRPGFGDSLDKFRVEQLWKLLHVPVVRKGSRKAGMKQPEGGEQFWIMMRRISGGLDAARQNALFSRLRPTLFPGKGRNAPKPGANELAEMWRAVAGLERLDVRIKEQLGASLLKVLRRSPTPNHGFPSLTRLGARILPYGPMNCIVHPQVVEKWIDAITNFKPNHESEKTTWLFCLVQLSRRTGQRALDIEDGARASVLALLKSMDAPENWRHEVEAVTQLESEERGRLLGDELPIGLRLATDSGGSLDD